MCLYCSYVFFIYLFTVLWQNTVTSSDDVLSACLDQVCWDVVNSSWLPFLQWLYCSLHFFAKDGVVILCVGLRIAQYWWISIGLVTVQLRGVFCPSVQYLSFFCEAFSRTILNLPHVWKIRRSFKTVFFNLPAKTKKQTKSNSKQNKQQQQQTNKNKQTNKTPDCMLNCCLWVDCAQDLIFFIYYCLLTFSSVLIVSLYDSDMLTAD